MARYGVLGDIHGNREALEAVLRELDARGVRRLLCVGDIVGYNADPDECVALLRSRGVAAIAGNHDLISQRRLDFGRCSNIAEYALRRTRRTIGREASAWLSSLPSHLILEKEFILVHGGVRDVQQYMVTPAHIRDNAKFLAQDFPGARVCFFGHSHEQRVYEVSRDGARDPSVSEVPTDGEVHLRKENAYFINPGSVDASRKSRHKLAECAIFDSSFGTVQFLRARYDAAATEAKAAAFGYRINPLTNRLYTLRRRTASAARRIGARLQRGADSGR
jgi:predicted phosphodiesterase